MCLNASLLLNTKAKLGEGAIWDAENNILFWVDIEKGQLNSYDPVSAENKPYTLNKRVGTVVPIDSERVLLALEDGIVELNLLNGELDYRVTVIHPNNKRFNDGKCDSQGRFWVGTLSMDNINEVSELYCIAHDFNLTPKINGLTISNGIVWSADNNTMYHIDTPTCEISKYDFDPITGNISNRQVAITIPQGMGYPDGMTIDNEGMLWIALWDGFCVVRYNPLTGELLQKINVPAPKVTSCAFGGKDLDQLYITTASVEMTEDELIEFPLSGSLFIADAGVKGVPSFKFKMKD